MDILKETPINKRLFDAGDRVWLLLKERREAGLEVRWSGEAHRLLLVVHATTRVIDFRGLASPFPKGCYDLDKDAMQEVLYKVVYHAQYGWFQKSPTNLLLADSLEFLVKELERYEGKEEPEAFSSLGSGSDRGDNHPLQQELTAARKKQREEEEAAKAS